MLHCRGVETPGLVPQEREVWLSALKASQFLGIPAMIIHHKRHKGLGSRTHMLGTLCFNRMLVLTRVWIGVASHV